MYGCMNFGRRRRRRVLGHSCSPYLLDELGLLRHLVYSETLDAVLQFTDHTLLVFQSLPHFLDDSLLSHVILGRGVES